MQSLWEESEMNLASPNTSPLHDVGQLHQVQDVPLVTRDGRCKEELHIYYFIQYLYDTYFINHYRLYSICISGNCIQAKQT